jgi:hypothetical protein
MDRNWQKQNGIQMEGKTMKILKIVTPIILAAALITAISCLQNGEEKTKKCSKCVPTTHKGQLECFFCYRKL